MPPDWDLADASAVQAMAHGRATEDQQRRGMKFIVEKLCGTYDLSFRHGVDGDRATALHEGRRFVGLQLTKFINLNLSAFRKQESEHG